MSERRIKLNGIQRKIAEKMVESKRTIPHVTTIREIRMDAVTNLREELKEKIAGENKKLTYMPFIIKAVADGIQEYPLMNSSYDEAKKEVILKEDINIGFAVGVGEKLVVPVLKNVENMNFVELIDRANELTEKCKDGLIAPEDMTGGTFTITNSGAFGGEIFTPIINYPQSAILGIGKIQKKPIVDKNDNIIVCPMMHICLSYDHRIINGATAVQFLGSIEKNLTKGDKIYTIM